MDEATKAKLKAAGFEAVVTAFEKTAGDLTTAQATIAEKDGIIATKNADLINARKAHEKEYKKLADMSEAEKANLSDKEKELLERQEKLESDQREFATKQAESLKKEVDARRARAFEKIVGTKDPELRKKLEDSFGKIVDSDKAQTDEEIAAVALSAFNMLGVPRPEGVRNAINESGGGSAGGAVEGDFAETTGGKGLLSAMNLPTEVPATPPPPAA